MTCTGAQLREQGTGECPSLTTYQGLKISGKNMLAVILHLVSVQMITSLVTEVKPFATVELGVEFPHVVISLICADIGPGGWGEIIQCSWTRVAARDAFYATSLVTLQLRY